MAYLPCYEYDEPVKEGVVIQLKRMSSCAAIMSFLIFGVVDPVWSNESDLLTRMVNAIKKGPLVYYSPEAVQAFTQSGQPVSVAADRESAIKSFKAHITLAELGAASSGAVPVLMETFCHGIHVSTIKEAKYDGEGTFDDWVSTYVMSEKNKFVLSSPFLDYNSMSICENFIETSQKTKILDKTIGAGGRIRKATADIQIVLTFHVGACALAKITGENPGTDPQAWRDWWAENKHSFNAAVSDSSKRGAPSQDQGEYGKLLVGGKYRMVLTTGDELVGYVESKTDTSVIFETVDKKPYTFRKALILTSELLAPPRKEISKDKAMKLSFEELKTFTLKNVDLKVDLKNGTDFRGTVASLEPDILKLDVEGSTIPISRKVIDKIRTVPEGEKKEKKVKKTEKKKMGPPFDTLVVKNSEVDEYGRRGPDLVLHGKIEDENSKKIVLTSVKGKTRNVSRVDIHKIIRHSGNEFEGPIKKYSKPLDCPEGMVLVDLPPGAPDRPFFKVCIDKYEYPNEKESLPKGNISYAEAKKICESQGKRLCTVEEWKWACSGKDDFPFPYGKKLDKEVCNTEGTRNAEPSGYRHNCKSKYGVNDMVGNIFEWVSQSNGKPALMGGPLSRCSTVTPGGGGAARPQIGLRCCKGN
ncbi:MAG: formylglycine-generating enzyme family protein [Chitinispirillaceae bacterium]